MEKIRIFDENINIENKRVILRSDFNVPIKNGLIQDKTRIDLSIPFIQNLLKRKAKVILISHLGRPKITENKLFSLKSAFNYLQDKINYKLYFYSEKITKETKEKISFLSAGELIFFDNIRFNDGEIRNDDNFAKNLSSFGDIYINDAFSCSHRKQASINKITKYVNNCYGGPLLKKELNAINLIIQNKKKPVTCIIGGSKVSTKINVITNLIKNVDNIIIVGAMANNFLTFEGFIVGKSLVEKETKEIINKIYTEAKKYNCNIFIPEDCSVSTNFEGSGKTKELNSISKDEIILDIGPKTIKKIESIIDQSNTILWNGPAGYFENTNFSTGTMAIAKKISESTARKSLISILGGGDTISAIKNSEDKFTFTHLSTAGGAFLEFLEGKDLPGLNVLK